MSTTYAKERFALTTTDIGRIQGYRRPGGKGGTLTMYYVLDLKDAAIAKHGQQHFDNHVPEGKELSGVAATERAEKEEQERVAAQIARDRAQYAVVPPERLLNKGLDQLQAILIRCEGGRQKPPYEKSKAGCIERILKAGYDVAAEVAAVEKQKAADDERRAQQEAERAVLRAKIEKEAAAAKAKAEAAAALKAERVKMFEAGSLSIDELKYDEIQHQLSRLGVPGKERVGKKEDLRTRLKEACVGKSRVARYPRRRRSRRRAPPPTPQVRRCQRHRRRHRRCLRRQLKARPHRSHRRRLRPLPPTWPARSARLTPFSPRTMTMPMPLASQSPSMWTTRIRAARVAATRRHPTRRLLMTTKTETGHLSPHIVCLCLYTRYRCTCATFSFIGIIRTYTRDTHSGQDQTGNFAAFLPLVRATRPASGCSALSHSRPLTRRVGRKARSRVAGRRGAARAPAP